MAQASAPADSATTTAASPSDDADESALEPAAATPTSEEEQAPTTASAPASSDPAPAEPATEEAPAQNASERQAEAVPLAWRNSFFTWTQGVTLASFDRGANLSYNPTYYHFFFLNPRWYLDAQTFLVLGAGAFVEATQDDTWANEFLLTDLSVEIRRLVRWEGFIFLPSARLGVPTSKASQGFQRIANTGGGLTVVRPIPEAAGMTIAAAASYRRWWASSNVSNSPDGVCASVGECSLAGESDRIAAGFSINVTPLEHLTLTASAFWFWINSFPVADGSAATHGGGMSAVPNLYANRWDNFTSYSLSVAYDPVEWLNVSIGWSNSTFIAPLYTPSGNVRNPFQDPDQQVTLNLQMTLDAFYNELTHPTGEADDGLTPEERQRRRQGLGSNDSDENNTPTRTTRF